MWHDGNAGQVKSVRIPADLDRDFAGRVPVSVFLAGILQEVQLVSCHQGEVPQQLFRQGCSPIAVAGITGLVVTAGVMENGKKVDHFRIPSLDFSQAQAVFKHPAPMVQTVNVMRIEPVLRSYLAQEGTQVDHRCLIIP